MHFITAKEVKLSDKTYFKFYKSPNKAGLCEMGVVSSWFEFRMQDRKLPRPEGDKMKDHVQIWVPKVNNSMFRM